MSTQKIHTYKKSGFAMLFAVLVSALVLSIGISIFNLTIKELSLASVGRESQFAFYAADSGAECAIYWDFTKLYMFATSSASQSGNWRDSYITAANPTCAGGSMISAMQTPTTAGALNAVSQFTMTINPEGYCAIVTIDKTVDGSGFVTTLVTSRGYNTCNNSDPTRVERALRIRY